MKPLFDPEVAKELGYQTYWPELSDWIIGTVACLVGGVVVVGGLVFLVTALSK